MQKNVKIRDSIAMKHRLVDVTYHLIAEQGAESVSIREIGRRAGCTSAALYKHFESLDYLILVSSMRFLEDYLKEVAVIESRGSGYVQQALDDWHAFNHYAFENPPVFLNMFWSESSASFADAVLEYFNLYHSTSSKQDEVFFGYLLTAAFHNSIQERELVLLGRGATEGTLRLSDVQALSKIDCYIVEGMLREHISDYREPGVAHDAAAECDMLLQKAIDTFKIGS